MQSLEFIPGFDHFFGKVFAFFLVLPFSTSRRGRLLMKHIGNKAQEN
jgi:hypothetical protein